MILDLKKAQDLEQGVNQGVVAPSNDETLVQGVLDMSQFPIVAPDSDLDKFLSDFDEQYQNGYDTLGCNIFSSIGGVEMDVNAMGGDPDYVGDSRKTEFSERKACVDAGLNGTMGSSEQQWENAINNFGLVKENDWPWTPGMPESQYFGSETPDVKAKGLKFLTKYTPFHRPIGTDLASIKEALKYGPVKIFVGTGPGWNVGEPGVVPVNHGAMNHAVLVRKIDDLGIHIRDQYPPFLKCLDPNYVVFYAFQTLLKKNQPFRHTFNKDLQYGMTDPEMISLQMVLSEDGEFPGSVAYNQHFGPATLAAVQAFQKKYGIANPGDQGFGRVGPHTRRKLNELYGY